ncbi:MAG: NAD(P)(+) transhydrogenase (Re/Si-specific) subunit beta [Phycisphaerae bacterium]
MFLINLFYLGSATLFIFGLKMLSSPRSARRGNVIASVGMAIAIIATMFDARIPGSRLILLLVALGIGGGIGATLALRVNMRGMPQMVALLNGFGGMAAAMVGFGEYLRELHVGLGPHTGVDFRVSVSISILIGMITLTGSLIAWAKLEEIKWNKIALSSPISLPMHPLLAGGNFLLMILLIVAIVAYDEARWAAILLLILAAVAGKLLVLPIGGADMPVVIALLNSGSGVGAAATGFVLNNNALIIGGSLVGASGFILTMIMCKAMNRSLLNVLAGGFGGGSATAAAGGDPSKPAGTVRRMDAEEAAMVLEAASSVIVIPGYGMAVAQAQHAVAEMAHLLQKRGVKVKFGVHPVAGRMPGHMNVLLAEANVEYDLLADLEINPEFEQCDVALVIGANDVVNPAARHDKTSPIFGMPIFDADKAKTVMVCKRGMAAGYAGIENELFYLQNCVMLFGDAKATIAGICTQLKAS